MMQLATRVYYGKSSFVHSPDFLKFKKINYAFNVLLGLNLSYCNVTQVNYVVMTVCELSQLHNSEICKKKILQFRNNWKQF